VKARVMVMLEAVDHPFERRERYLATRKHKRYKIFLCLFVGSFLFGGEFSFLFFLEALLIFLYPGFEIG
jgi:hypothetical protein